MAQWISDLCLEVRMGVMVPGPRLFGALRAKCGGSSPSASLRVRMTAIKKKPEVASGSWAGAEDLVLGHGGVDFFGPG